MAGFSPPPSFSITTNRLHISYFQPGNESHSTFLHQAWNTDEFVEAEGKTGLNTPGKAARFHRPKIQVDYNRNKYGQTLVSLKPRPGPSLAESKMIGVVSLMKGDLYTCPNVGYTILSEKNGKRYATKAAIGLVDSARAN
ncbi:hypothetical protein BDV23DRAFT_185041 [Aspergillus alliaceus]|uniref:N-acetyltransferase domain-containing protein n=1 Tax=Petromyces alliaceus TaxID=209559 RepID=A0A5N7C3S9_PETAA|nr:hypothetical protein BDV23DRAFT_185041 [Aspergillus alliaceus]